MSETDQDRWVDIGLVIDDSEQEPFQADGVNPVVYTSVVDGELREIVIPPGDPRYPS